MNRRSVMQAFAGFGGLSLLGGGDEATDGDVREAVEAVETDDGAGDSVSDPDTSSNGWTLAALDVGELQSEVDEVRASGSAETITGGLWDPFVDVDVVTDFGTFYVSFSAEEARQVAQRLQAAAEEAEAEAVAAEQAEDWDDLQGGPAPDR